uniref:Uncharacterized protein n=1 Tax=Sphenodon punctatus TaxID=8508 RepID=A0A8D0HN39_SPHPU
MKEGFSAEQPGFLMEEAPQGTFQDELEWCISQLERGLLRLNPTPRQVEETKHVLKVLQSHKAPFVKKRQVMNRVFGNYQLKMAKEKKEAEKAATKPGKVQIQQVDMHASGSVMYRKQSGQTSNISTNCFTPSDNSFRFGFVPSETGSVRGSGTLEDAQEASSSEERVTNNSSSQPESLKRALSFATSGQGAQFAFNFVIPVEGSSMLPSIAPNQERESAATEATGCGSASGDAMEMLANPALPETVGGERERRFCTLETPKLDTIPIDSEAKAAQTAAATGATKKKRKPPNCLKETKEVMSREKVKGANGHPDKGASHQNETSQPSDEQLWREMDWCVEQLELGLKTQKSTPKQVAEALRAIKTLRSDKAVLAKKRQIMRAMFGDYRKKMEEERQKQLKLMQAAAKSAQVTEVSKNASRKTSQVFRKHSEVGRNSQSPATSPPHPPGHPASPRMDGMDSFVFTTSQEEFCFNFF